MSIEDDISPFDSIDDSIPLTKLPVSESFEKTGKDIAAIINAIIVLVIHHLQSITIID